MRHLSDEQIAAAMVEQDAEVGAHLRECAACAAKVEHLQATLKDFGSFVHANAERTNTFWWRQQAAAPQRAIPLTRWAAAAAAVIIAIGASTTLLNNVGKQQPRHVVDGNPSQGQVKTTISDEALLSEVQTDVRREYADAFAPVQTNAESAVAQQATAPSAKKEHKSK